MVSTTKFEDVYGCMTTENDCPSLKTSGKKSHGIPFSPSAQTARLLVMCSECLKPRVIYSKQKLTIWEEHALERTLDNILFTCGSSLTGLEIEKLRSDPPSVQTVLGRVCQRKLVK